MYKIIIIEDEDIIRKNLIFSIDYSELNCIVVGDTNNGKNGIELIKKLNPHIVIMDINMPIINGLTLLEETLNYDYCPIIISGYDNFNYIQKTLKYGAIDYILKPIDMNELKDAILNAINIFEMRFQYKKLKENNYLLNKQNKNLKNNSTADFMLNYIKENYENKISIKDLKDILNYSESLLNIRFKQATGLTFNDYINRYRITKSIELLKTNKYQISEIAYKVGFSDSKYFSKVFKKYLGINPTEFNLI